MRAAVIACLASAACAPVVVPAAAPLALAPAAAAPPQPAPRPPPLAGCEPGVELRVSMAGELVLACWPESSCARALELVVTNCTDDDLELAELGVDLGGDHSRGYEFADEMYVLGPRSTRRVALGWPEPRTVWELGPHTLRARAARAGSRHGESHSWHVQEPYEAATTFFVADPARDHARARGRETTGR